MSKPRITPIIMPKLGSTAETNSLSGDDRDHAGSAAGHIRCAFGWGDTAEGDAFWRSVTERLQAIADGEPLR